MMQSLEFKRVVDSVLIQLDQRGVWIYCGWTVPIPKAKAVEYVQQYNASHKAGFTEHQGRVVLSHGDGKISFSRQEGEELVALIKSAYLVG